MPRATKSTTIDNPYSPHPSVSLMVKWVDELKAKTGRSLDEWMTHIKKSGPKEMKDRWEWLKTEHKLGTNHAWWLAELSIGKGWEDLTPESNRAHAPKLVDAMFEGKKAALRPIYEELLRLGLAVGPDAKACPCQTIVPLYRTHVFAEIKPATNTRLDMGYALGDTPVSGRLIDTGGLARKNRITHRIPITSLADIDAEVRKWLQVAYEREK